MSVKWTEEQQAVISLRGKNLLVSAAAGSGKTAVLVERILSLITDPEHPVNLDELLVVTFTRAAAGEMKERIGAALEKKLTEDPGNVHLQQQGALLHHAQISTIHGFCTFVIRNYYQRIDLDPGYRIGDENELSMIKREVLGNVIEERYARNRPEFLDFSESFASGKTDGRLEDLVLQVYEQAVSEPWPGEWLEQCRKASAVATEEELENIPWMQAVLTEAENRKESIRLLQEKNLEDMRREDAPSCYADNIAYDRDAVDALCSCCTYEDYRRTLTEWEKTRLSSRRLQKGEDPGLKEQIKNRHNRIWDQIAVLRGQYFSRTLQEILQEMQDTDPFMQELVQLTSDFITAFGEEKRKRNLCDFSDLEHFALRILLEKTEDGTLRRTDAARELSRRYAAVMIDEYQDSNYIQEALLAAVSGNEEGRNNRFMVGDIKQSIYGFRQARPDLFLEKYHSYPPFQGKNGQGEQEGQTVPAGREAKKCSGEQSLRIDLFQNFRSRPQVLDTVNALFRKLMVPEFGGITYDDAAALHYGAAYYPDSPDPDFPDSELLLLDRGSEEFQEDHGRDVMMEAEARMAAVKIRKIQREGWVWDKNTEAFRRPEWKDFAVLLRSVSGWADVFVKVLNEEGVPAYSLSREGYFSAMEVVLVLDYLRILDNPRQEIPFAAALHSPIGNLTDTEMALLKTTFPESPVYEAAEKFAQSDLSAEEMPESVSGKEAEERAALKNKLQAFFETYHQLRAQISFTAVHDLVQEVLDRTGFGDYAASMPAGEQRRANLDMLTEKAYAFEQMGNYGLFSFIRYIERMNRYQIDEGEVNLYSENENIVRVMTIHKSKGLEFPIVFVSGLGKQFNLSDQKGNILLNSRLGIGLEDFHPETRTKHSTLQRSAIALQNSLESRAEELRVLYVAMTRAKEKLIMTGVVTDAAGMPEPEDIIPYADLAGARCYLDWILPARPEDRKILDTQIISGGFLKEEEEWTAENYIGNLRKIPGDQPAGKERETDPDTDGLSLTGEAGASSEEGKTEGQILQTLRRITAFSYPYSRAASLPAKMTVSELKKAEFEEMQEDRGKEMYSAEEMVPYIPAFMREKKLPEETTGASRGTIWHHFLQTFEYGQIKDTETEAADLEGEVRREKERMLDDGILSPADAAAISEREMAVFLSSNLGERMLRAARKGSLRREQPFVLDVPADEIDSSWPADEKILVQGIIDAYFEEEGSFVLVDYKTDRVHIGDGRDLVEKYRTQLLFYRRALEQITGTPVRETWLYSFALGKMIRV